MPKCALHNVYGPTEATVDSGAWTLEPGAPVPGLQLPIGRAISNTRLYVLDEHDRPVPLGCSCISARLAGIWGVGDDGGAVYR